MTGPAATAGTVLGVDVAAERRGCDAVALTPDGVAHPQGKVRGRDGMHSLVAAVRPAVVGIDAPRGWAAPGSRRSAERILAARGFSLFTTPDAARGETRPFYAWMRHGFAVHAGAEAVPTYETYPHAVAVVLRGGPPGTGLLRDPRTKLAWRRGALDVAGVDHSALRTIDEVDAALCAVAARAVLDGTAELLGDPAEGLLALPLSRSR